MSDEFPIELRVENPLELTGDAASDRAFFYDLAQNRIEYQTRDENKSWNKKYRGKEKETTATYVIRTSNNTESPESARKWVDGLRIIVNIGLFEAASKHAQEDFTDLIPYVVEHEIYESWLRAKRGVGQQLDLATIHLLARRREFYLAALNGQAEKLYRFQILINPTNIGEHESALRYGLERAGMR